MKKLFIAALSLLEACTLDLIPMYFKRHYKMNKDESGFYFNTKIVHNDKNSSPETIVYYPDDKNMDGKTFTKESVKTLYTFRLIQASIAHLFALIIIGVSVSENLIAGIFLYPLLLVIMFGFIALIGSIGAMLSKDSWFSRVKVISVESPLASLSSVADRVNLVSYQEAFFGKISPKVSAKDLTQKNSDYIKVRHML